MAGGSRELGRFVEGYEAVFLTVQRNTDKERDKQTVTEIGRQRQRQRQADTDRHRQTGRLTDRLTD